MILGAVLAGGYSTRFGSDKAMALWMGIPLIEHVIGRLQTVCDTVIVCGRTHDPISVPDRPFGGLGPLGGLAGAFRYADDHGFDRTISAPCDAPRLSDDLLAVLAEAQTNSFVRDMPVLGCWRSAEADRLESYLVRQRDRSMRAWARTIGATPLILDPPANINRRQDLENLNDLSSLL